jgi:hypothetical protein
MADVPDAIVLKRDRDLEGRQTDIWVPRVVMALVAAKARASQIASLEDVQWAVFEPTGAISFIPKK